MATGALASFRLFEKRGEAPWSELWGDQSTQRGAAVGLALHLRHETTQQR